MLNSMQDLNKSVRLTRRALGRTQRHAGQSRDVLLDSVRTLIADAQDLAHALGNVSEDGLSVARDGVSTGRQLYADARGKMRSTMKDAADNASDYLDDKPWRAVAAAVGAGVLLAVLLGRRGD